MNNRKIVVLIIILAFLLGIFAIAKKDEPSVKQNVEIGRLNADYIKDPTWLTYTDKQYPISFDYPANGVFQVSTLSKEAEYNTYFTNRKGPTEEPQYTIWFSLVPKSETPAGCIDPTSEGREYSTHKIETTTVYAAKGISEDVSNLHWHVVCINIPDETYFLSLITSDYSDGDIIQSVIDSVSLFQKS